MKPPLTGWQRPAALQPTPNSNNRGLRVTKFQNWYQSPYFWLNPVTSSKFGGEECGVDGSNRNGDLGPFSISYLESSNLVSHLASSSIPSNLWGFLSLILHKSLGPKSLGLFWNAPYCFPSDALLTSPCISVKIIVTSRVNSIVTSLNAAP